ncbi:MAG: NUDIX domain-containing protein [Patescibacteria group bacterium]
MKDKQLLTVSLISKEATIEKNKVSAVFLIGFFDEKIIVTRNERGWDIPGGYLKKKEELLEGLRRETEEEAGVFFTNAVPFAKLSASNKNKHMVFFASNSCTLSNFIKKSDVFERDLLSVKIFIKHYYGDKDLMFDLIQKAQESLK